MSTLTAPQSAPETPHSASERTDGVEVREWCGSILRRAETEDGYRRIDALVVPAGVIETRGYGRERFLAGAFDEWLRDEGDHAVVLRNGHYSPMVGVGEAHWRDTDGLHMTFRVADTRAGEDAMRMVDGEFVRGISPEFVPIESETSKTSGVTTIRRARLVGAALVHRQAYPAAVVEDIREEVLSSTPRVDAWGRLRERRRGAVPPAAA